MICMLMICRAPWLNSCPYGNGDVTSQFARLPLNSTFSLLIQEKNWSELLNINNTSVSMKQIYLFETNTNVGLRSWGNI